MTPEEALEVLKIERGHRALAMPRSNQWMKTLPPYVPEELEGAGRVYYTDPHRVTGSAAYQYKDNPHDFQTPLVRKLLAYGIVPDSSQIDVHWDVFKEGEMLTAHVAVMTEQMDFTRFRELDKWVNNADESTKLLRTIILGSSSQNFEIIPPSERNEKLKILINGRAAEVALEIEGVEERPTTIRQSTPGRLVNAETDLLYSGLVKMRARVAMNELILHDSAAAEELLRANADNLGLGVYAQREDVQRAEGKG